MSYADARVDLTPVGIACLTGLNGAGKSALLDAITWALWESARASSDEIVRLGQTEMWVDLCFSLENQVYRVRRARQKAYGRNGNQVSSKGNLDLQIWDGEPEGWHYSYAISSTNSPTNSSDRIGWRSLSASSMRDTQKRLREILRMDYETFISSVYLKQGRADEFTTRSANERKQVLSDILGLEYFDQLQELAREEARDCKARIQVLESTLSDAPDLEQGFKDSCADIEVLHLQIQSISGQIDESKLVASELESQVAKYNYLQIRAETARARQLELRSDLGTLEHQLVESRTQKQRLQRLLEQADFVNEQNNYFEEYKQVSEKMEFTSQAYSELASKRMEARSRLALMQGRLEVELDHLTGTIESRIARQKDLEKSTREKNKMEESFKDFRRLSDAELEMSRNRELFASLSARADQLQSLIAEARVRLESEIQQKEATLIELDQILTNRGQIEAEQNNLEEEARNLDLVEAQFELVEEKGLKVKSQIESQQQEIILLKKHIRENDDKVHELCSTPDLSSCPLCRSPIVDSKAVLDRYNDDNKNSGSEISRLETSLSRLEDERDELRKQYTALRKKLEERKKMDRKIGEFNERKHAIERAESTREEIRQGLELARKKMLEQGFAPVEKESLIRVKAEISKLEFDPIVFSNLQAQMRSQRHIEVRYQQVQRDLKELNELSEELPLLESRRVKMQKELKEESFGPDHRGEIALLEASMRDLAYDKEAHQHLKRKLVELLPFAEKARDIRKALVELPELEKNFEHIEAMVNTRREELLRLEDEESERANILDELPKLRLNLEQLNQKRQELEEENENLKRRKLVLEMRLSQLAEDKSLLESKRQALADSIKEMSEFTLLAEAFGKKGIQAIIIENAIPEIEFEANRILARLTENQMHIAIATQQRTRQGNPIETLEILIADEIGTRAYELYSGGEAFKVNFAIRVALSRLLARRAGAKLETLIIDEGFGSQDENSRTKLIQAINSIKQDFARIIVVTHISEVKEMFPVQISVSKEDGISRVAILA